MGFFGNIITSVVKVALTPIAIVKDVAIIAVGRPKDATATKDLLSSAANDAEKAIDDIT
jgi:DNA-binding protein YbaB